MVRVGYSKAPGQVSDCFQPNCEVVPILFVSDNTTENYGFRTLSFRIDWIRDGMTESLLKARSLPKLVFRLSLSIPRVLDALLTQDFFLLPVFEDAGVAGAGTTLGD